MVDLKVGLCWGFDFLLSQIDLVVGNEVARGGQLLEKGCRLQKT